MKFLKNFLKGNKTKRREKIAPDNLEAINLASESSAPFNLELGGAQARVRVEKKERFELLFIVIGYGEVKAPVDLSLLPGSGIDIRIDAKAAPETTADAIALIADKFSPLAGNEEKRIFFILEGESFHLLSRLAARFSRSTLIAEFADQNFAPASDFGGTILSVNPEGSIFQLDPASGNFNLVKESSPGASREQSLTDAANLAPEFADAKTIRVSPIEIKLKQLYILSFARNIEKDKIKFVCSGRPELAPVEIDQAFDWNSNPYNDKNWAAQLQMWRVMDDYLLLYEKSGDPGWLEAPKNVIKWWRYFYKENEPAPAVWMDMNAGIRTMKLAYFLSLIRRDPEKFDREFATICEELAESHLLFIINYKKSIFTNHSLIDLHGLTALCQVVKPHLALKGYGYIDANFDAIMDSQFDENGVHREHSPGYQIFALSYLRILAGAGWFKTEYLKNIEGKAKVVLDWMRLPDGRLAPIGDTDFNIIVKSKSSLKLQDEIFNRSGYAIARRMVANDPRKSSYLLFMGAANSKAHKHSDDLSVFWYEGEEILCDSGKYAYQNSPRRDYVISTRAHNTIEINGADTFVGAAKENNPPPGNYITSAREKDGLLFLTGEMEIPRFKVRHQRLLIYGPGNFLIAIDRLESKNINRYAANWHFPSTARVEATGEGELECFLNGGKKVYAALFSTNAGRATLVKGQIKPIMQGFISESYRLLTPNYCASLTAEGENMVIISAFFVDRRPALNFHDNNLFFFNNYMYDIERDALSSL